MNPAQLGRSGEVIAAIYLARKGFRMIGNNYRTKYGEIDLIGKDPKDGVLVFIEVKSVRLGSLHPEDNMSWMKLRKLVRICQFFANANPQQVGPAGWRMDLIALTLDEERNVWKLKHYENI